MIIKYKHILRKKSINNICLRLQRKGCFSYPVFKIIIVNKKSREKKGKVLDCIGIYNPNFNERILFIHTSKLYFWLQRNLFIHYKVKSYLIKFLIPKIIKRFDII